MIADYLTLESNWTTIHMLGQQDVNIHFLEQIARRLAPLNTPDSHAALVEAIRHAGNAIVCKTVVIQHDYDGEKEEAVTTVHVDFPLEAAELLLKLA